MSDLDVLLSKSEAIDLHTAASPVDILCLFPPTASKAKRMARQRQAVEAEAVKWNNAVHALKGDLRAARSKAVHDVSKGIIDGKAPAPGEAMKRVIELQALVKALDSAPVHFSNYIDHDIDAVLVEEMGAEDSATLLMACLREQAAFIARAKTTGRRAGGSPFAYMASDIHRSWSVAHPTDLRPREGSKLVRAASTLANEQMARWQQIAQAGLDERIAA